jgi:hypothetical protein
LTSNGTVNVNGLQVVPNNKNGSALTGCYTFGTERSGTNLPNFAFTSNNQSGYTINSNTFATEAYKAFGTTDASNGGPAVQWYGSGYSDGSSSPFNGLYAGNTYLVDSSNVTHKGNYLLITFPNTVVVAGFQFYQLTYYNTPRAIKAYTLLGRLVDTDPWEAILVKTLTNPQIFTTVTETFRNSKTYKYFSFVIRQIVPAYEYAGNLAVSLSKFQINCVSVSENIHIPQSLEVGISSSSTLNTAYTLQSNGYSLLNGDTTVSGTVSTDSLKVLTYNVYPEVNLGTKSTTSVQYWDWSVTIPDWCTEICLVCKGVTFASAGNPQLQITGASTYSGYTYVASGQNAWAGGIDLWWAGLTQITSSITLKTTDGGTTWVVSGNSWGGTTNVSSSCGYVIVTTITKLRFTGGAINITGGNSCIYYK